MIKEHDRVVLTESVPAEGLEPGDVGTVVHVYADGKAYEVELVALDGHTRAVATLEVRQVRPVSRHDMTHARDSDGLRPMAGSRVRKDKLALQGNRRVPQLINNVKRWTKQIRVHKTDMRILSEQTGGDAPT